MQTYQTVSTAFSWIKLLVNLLLIASIIGAVIICVATINQKLSPAVGGGSLVVTVGLFIWSVMLMSSPKLFYRKPNLALVLLSIIAITLVCAFAGIQPLATYKDDIINRAITNFNGLNSARKARLDKEAQQKLTPGNDSPGPPSDIPGTNP